MNPNSTWIHGECECCGRDVPTPYHHSGRDGRPDTDYCQDCYDAECDLVDCEVIAKMHAGKPMLHGKPAFPALLPCNICGGAYAGAEALGHHLRASHAPEQIRAAREAADGPTPEELAETYRSLGVDPALIPEEGT